MNAAAKVARAHGPYLIHSRPLNKFYRAPGPGESAGHWVTDIASATIYTRQDEPARTITRISGRLTRHLTHIVTIGHAHKLAAAGVPTPHQEAA